MLATKRIRSVRLARWAFASLGLALLSSALPAVGQVDDGRRVYVEQLRVRLDQQVPQAQEVGVEYGGWFSFALFNYDDEVGRIERTLRQYQLRGWASGNVEGVHRAYVRGLLGYDDWNAGTNPKVHHGDEYTGLEIERAWYQFDLGQLLLNENGVEPPVAFRVKVGRAFAEIGTALTLSMPLDMVQMHADIGDWQVMGLLGKTVSETPNIDDSFAVWDHQRRCLWGVQLTYAGLGQHRPFAYFLSNDDQTEADPYDPAQSYEYTSQYIGLGSEGNLISPQLRYRAEIVGETGETYSAGQTSGTDPICAMAANALLEYYVDAPTRPRLSFEYLWASGDDDRQLSATSTVGGNRAGTTDHAFNAFGYRDTGLAFAPRLSNLHIYALGGSFYPLERYAWAKRLQVGSKLFLYHSSNSGGPISDPTAGSDIGWVGWEADVFADWRVTSDLSVTVRYGAFVPSGAFDNDSCRQMLVAAMHLSF